MVATADVTVAAASAVSLDEGMVTVAHSVTTPAGAAVSEDVVGVDAAGVDVVWVDVAGVDAARVDAASVAVDRGEAVSR